MQSALTSETFDSQAHDVTPFYSQPTDADKKSREVISRFYSQPIEFEPFGYSQDLDEYLTYQTNCLKSKVPEASTSTQKPSLQQNEQKTKKKTIKKKSCKKQLLQSHVIQKLKHGKRLIKICISNIEGNNDEEVIVQYVTQENTDPLLEETEELVERIVRKISANIKS